MKMHGVGVIGFGVWGCHGLERDLVRSGKAEIKAIAAGDQYGASCFKSQEEIMEKATAYAAEFGAELVDDWRKLIAREDIDIISAMACPKVKPEIIVEALKSGKHVVTDKPLGMDAGDARRILEAERASKAHGYMRSGYHGRPAVKRLIDAIGSGAIGELKALNLRLDFMGGVYPGFVATRRWRSEIPSAEMTTIGSHAFITALKMLPWPVESVYAVMKNDFHRNYEENGAEDYAIVNMRFATGAVANISVGRIPHRIPDEDIAIEATGTKGFAKVRGAIFELWPGGLKEDLWRDPRKLEEEVFADFISDIVEGSGRPSVSFEEGLRLQCLLDAAIKSSKTGKVVKPD